ncbi:sensor histidine kinase [Micromonospora polyrhachis]|uniref:histidine kinase n=1 Tax=Micromonospora polyrhachis TaxID=1282883 RepID=A0A7W7SMP0_9ACTN|nr:sensor histidine kinase [Micromonospora polyrhachis]MBB4957266.1 signal transduction histidine kinase [Micromonospora polyrhachis]
MTTPYPRTALEAIGRRRFLRTVWPWRSLAYLSTTLPSALTALVLLTLLGLPWVVLLRWFTTRADQPLGKMLFLALLGTGLIMAVGPLGAMPLATLERLRLRLIDDRPVTAGHRPPSEATPWAWLRTRYAEAATWRELGYLCLMATVVPVLYGVVGLVVLLLGVYAASPVLVQDGETVTLGFGEVATVGETLPYAIIGLLLLPTLVPYLLTSLAGVHGALARALLHGGSDERLRAELVEVSRSRARLVAAFEAERRRIERDLHDGAQQRLVGLTLQLGLARLDLPPGSASAQAVATAHEQAKQLMAELREFIHGIHPQVLTDRGLTAAVQELASQAAIEVVVHGELTGRLPDHIEATAYFVVAEALTNVAKHSAATRAAVTVRQQHDRLIVEIDDDGRGGADPAGGTGLTGLADRVAVVDGRMLLSSPVGGPTRICVELPCG